MKKLMFAASVLALCAVGAVDASAQRREGGARWEGGHGAPPPGAWRFARPHSYCVDKARQLHEFERRAASDGRVDRRERRIDVELRAELDRDCGGGRWNPDRGWYH